MKTQDYRVAILVNASSGKAFDCINDVTKWWTENLEGNSKELNDEFTVRFWDVHVSTQKLIEIIPDKKIVWLVTSSNLNFIEKKDEWTDTKISFEISNEKDQTKITFTHTGLGECFKDCSNAWSEYIQGSLLSLINTGKGNPTPKEK